MQETKKNQGQVHLKVINLHNINNFVLLYEISCIIKLETYMFVIEVGHVVSRVNFFVRVETDSVGLACKYFFCSYK